MNPVLRTAGWAMVIVVLVAACAGPRRAPPAGANAQMRPITEQEQNIRLMLSLDGNSDGTVTREEMETALKRQFDACDLNHDGRIDLQEMQIENDRRYRAFGTAASPLIDWNRNGQIEFDEFATTARSLFAELDRNQDGKLESNELRLPTGRGVFFGPPPRQEGGR